MVYCVIHLSYADGVNSYFKTNSFRFLSVGKLIPPKFRLISSKIISKLGSVGINITPFIVLSNVSKRFIA